MDEWAHDALQGNMREVPLAPARLAVLATARCEEVIAELTERMRGWCRGRGMVPHSSLDVAASIALALAANGVPLGPRFFEEMTQRAEALDTPGGLSGLVDAARQAIQYLSDTAPPLGP